MSPRTADDGRSPFATLVALMLFATVTVGSICIMSVLVSLGPGLKQSWTGVEGLPFASQLAEKLSRTVVGNYTLILAFALLGHVVLLVLHLIAGRTPERLLWAAGVDCFILSVQLLVLFWLAIAFTLPYLA